jgi:hypothetical protein
MEAANANAAMDMIKLICTPAQSIEPGANVRNPGLHVLKKTALGYE